MSITRGAIALLLGAPLMSAFPACAQDVTLLDEIIVTGVRPEAAIHAVRPEGGAAAAPDSAGLVARLPGAALIDNGGLSGQVQYRGLFGDRVLTRVNGQRFQSAGPNAMDPPLHYAPMPLVGSIEVDRGISPVRNGPALAGGVNARLKEVRFGEETTFAPDYDLTAGYRSVNNSRNFGGVTGMASDRVRVNLLGAHEIGGDLRFPGGVIRDSGFRRDTWGLSAGWRSGAGDLGLDLRAQETGPTGTPPFALDILYFDTDFAQLRFASPVGSIRRLEASLGHTRVEHAMENFSLRPAPAVASMRRLTLADSETVAGEARLIFGTRTRSLSVGTDFEDAGKSVTITHPDNPGFLIGSLPAIEVSRFGGYLEWRGAVRDVEMELGVRADAHRASAGEARTGAVVSIGPILLAAAFNAGDRDWSGETVDVVTRFWRTRGDFTPRLTLARKTRAPNAVERFSWLPTEASGGLADGNVYVGDRTLRPETAWIVEGGLDWRRGPVWARPTVYYRRVDNYIQGVPFDDTPGVLDTRVEMVAAMSGDSTPLRFANVDAELYGFDMDFGLQITDRLRVDGVNSVVRGRRRDISDDLYRIAPPTLRLSATWEETDWAVGAEVAGTLRQEHVSASNDETLSHGYTVVNVRGKWHLRLGLQLEAGVENLFDRDYRAHLAGRNRVAGSDVALGERLPGAGRGVFVTLKAAR